MAISWSTTAILVANIKQKQHTDRLIWIGPFSHIVGLALLFAAFATGLLALVFAGQFVIGAGFGMSWAYLSKMTMEETPRSERDKTSALLPTLQSPVLRWAVVWRVWLPTAPDLPPLRRRARSATRSPWCSSSPCSGPCLPSLPPGAPSPRRDWGGKHKEMQCFHRRTSFDRALSLM